MVVTAAGLTVMVPNVIAVVGFTALLVALELQFRGVEEPYLCGAHGDAYRAYAARVGRFIPGLGRLSRQDGSERNATVHAGALGPR